MYILNRSSGTPCIICVSVVRPSPLHSRDVAFSISSPIVIRATTTTTTTRRRRRWLFLIAAPRATPPGISTGPGLTARPTTAPGRGPVINLSKTDWVTRALGLFRKSTRVVVVVVAVAVLSCGARTRVPRAPITTIICASRPATRQNPAECIVYKSTGPTARVSVCVMQ